jgi:hypothetical protein
MFLQPNDLEGVIQAGEFGLVFYLCMAAAIVICFAIAIRLCGKWDGDYYDD